MKRISPIFIFAVLITVFCHFSALASDEQHRYGVGWQGSFPAWGLSVQYDVTEEFTAQGILGIFGNLHTYAGRGLYKFHKEEFWNAYGYGTIGIWSYDYGNDTESTVGFGAGSGIDYNLRAFSEDLPPLSFNLELGLSYVDLDYTTFNALTIGAGLHYRF